MSPFSRCTAELRHYAAFCDRFCPMSIWEEHVKYRGRYQKLSTTFFMTTCIYDQKTSKTYSGVDVRTMYCYVSGLKCKQLWKSCLQFLIPTWSGLGRGGQSMWNTFSVRLSRSAESGTEAIFLALHSVLHALKTRLITNGVPPRESQVRER